ncbi:MAG: FMN-binding protein, partial [Draconibacterium sp.]|nr:FMN-binding protein [Draconibacterium sp.]
KNVLKDKNISMDQSIEIEDSIDPERQLVVYRFNYTKNGELFYTVFTHSKGRYNPFDYILILSEDLTIRMVRILKYRSEFGGEIASKKWLRQFENYSSGELRYKKEISALSGATISAKSIVDDIPKVLNILRANICIN